MREIKFRGKSEKTGRWVYGYLINLEDGGYSIVKNLYCVSGGEYNIIEEEVISETIGQYTGLKDKDGKKIFEGDIVDFGTDGIALIKELDGYFKGVFGKNKRCRLNEGIGEIIGNIYENPELLDSNK